MRGEFSFFEEKCHEHSVDIWILNGISIDFEYLKANKTLKSKELFI